MILIPLFFADINMISKGFIKINNNLSVKGSGIEITEARGDEDVFPSSSLLREYVSLEGCELATKAYSTPRRPHPILR